MTASGKAAMVMASRCWQVLQHRRATLQHLCHMVSASPATCGGGEWRLQEGGAFAAEREDRLGAGCDEVDHRRQWMAAHVRRYSTAIADEGIPDEHEIFRSGPMAAYQRHIAEGTLVAGDAHQEMALAALQALYDVLIGAAADGHFAPARQQNRSLWARWLPKPQAASVRGLYLWGGVGTGKTMLMDMFYHELPAWLPKKRIHFHDFMLTVQGRLQMHRRVADPLASVAEELSAEATILCLDEFMVTDVADAMVLHRLFGHLMAKGVVLVSTSNRPPDRLYENGLQRDLFLPFIAMLKSRCVVHEIGSPTDYRRLTAVQRGFYFTGEDASGLLREKFHMLTEGLSEKEKFVEVVMGRRLHVPSAAQGIAYFTFYELCETPTGAADYIALAKHFHTVALDEIPKFGSSNISAAHRFVTLVDVMYEHKVRLICAAEALPVELFEKVVTIADAPRRTSSRSGRSDEVDLAVDNELGFAKERTISRLTEMQSSEYEEYHAAHSRRVNDLVQEEGPFLQAV